MTEVLNIATTFNKDKTTPVYVWYASDSVTSHIFQLEPLKMGRNDGGREKERERKSNGRRSHHDSTNASDGIQSTGAPN